MSVDEILVPSSNDKLQHIKSCLQLSTACWSLSAERGTMIVTLWGPKKGEALDLAAVRVRHLTCDCNFVIMIKANWTVLLVFIVENNRNSCFGDASLTLLVHQLLQVVGSDL